MRVIYRIKGKKKAFYSILLICGLIMLTFMFIFEKPDGSLGLFFCISGIDLVVVSVIRLCMLSKKFKVAFYYFLEFLFSLP